MPSPSLLISPQGSLTPSPRPYSPQGQIPFTCDPPQGRMSLLCDPLSRGRMPLLCDPLPHRRRPYTRAFITCGSMTSPLTSVTSDARHCSSSPPQITPNLSLTSSLSVRRRSYTRFSMLGCTACSVVSRPFDGKIHCFPPFVEGRSVASLREVNSHEFTEIHCTLLSKPLHHKFPFFYVSKEAEFSFFVTYNTNSINRY